MTIYTALDDKINILSDRIIDYARELLKRPSLSGRELEAQQYVLEVVKNLEADNIDFWEPDYDELKNHPAFVSDRTDFSGSPNLAATWKGAGEGRSLILCSHIDVVPEGEPAEWHHPPFGGEVCDGVIYGRGVSDMKGSMAAMFGAISAIKSLNYKLCGDLSVISTVEEETGSAGALSVALRGYRADAAIIPEPNGFALGPAQQGAVRFLVNIKGKSAHAGQRHMGVSAVEKADMVRRGIEEYEKYLNENYRSELYRHTETPFTINIGLFHSGDWFCTVPETARLEGRMAVPPGLTVVESMTNLRAFIQKETRGDPWLSRHPPEIEVLGTYWEPAGIPADHTIVLTAAGAYSSFTGREAAIQGTPWGTDGRMFTEFARTPALVFGPGTSAHCPDEFLPVADLLDYTKILARIIVQWCGVKGEGDGK